MIHWDLQFRNIQKTSYRATTREWCPHVSFSTSCGGATKTPNPTFEPCWIGQGQPSSSSHLCFSGGWGAPVFFNQQIKHQSLLWNGRICWCHCCVQWWGINSDKCWLWARWGSCWSKRILPNAFRTQNISHPSFTTIGDANVCYFCSQKTEHSCNWKGQKTLDFFQKILNGFRTSMFSRLQKIWCHQRFLFLRVIPEFSFFSAFSFRPAMDWFMVKSFMFKSESFVGVAIDLASNFWHPRTMACFRFQRSKFVNFLSLQTFGSSNGSIFGEITRWLQ